MSRLTVNTNDLESEGLDIEDVILEGGNLETAAEVDLEGGDIEVGVAGQSIVVDEELSRTSTNPVQNKVVTLALDDKVDESAALTNLEIEALLR
jgi:hypothetical protein